MKTTEKLTIIYIIYSIVLACASGGLYVIHAQEVERRNFTKHWHVDMLPAAGGSDNIGYDPVRVDVIDTSGACIYIARGFRGGAGTSPAIAVISKRDLQQGHGCQ